MFKSNTGTRLNFSREKFTAFPLQGIASDPPVPFFLSLFSRGEHNFFCHYMPGEALKVESTSPLSIPARPALFFRPPSARVNDQDSTPHYLSLSSFTCRFSFPPRILFPSPIPPNRNCHRLPRKTCLGYSLSLIVRGSF